MDIEKFVGVVAEPIVEYPCYKIGQLCSPRGVEFIDRQENDKYPFIVNRNVCIQIPSKYNTHEWLIVRMGYAFNGPSIPKYLRRLIPKKIQTAALIPALRHDVSYQLSREGWISQSIRKLVDLAFMVDLRAYFYNVVEPDLVDISAGFHVTLGKGYVWDRVDHVAIISPLKQSRVKRWTKRFSRYISQTILNNRRAFWVRMFYNSVRIGGRKAWKRKSFDKGPRNDE